MSGRQVQQYLRKISKPNPKLQGWPLCPALENRILDVHVVEYTPGVLDTICSTWSTLKPFAVAIYCIGKSDAWLDTQCVEIESSYPHIASLWHHPNTPRYIGTYKTPTPGIPLLILQSHRALLDEKARLASLGYYKVWK